VARVEGPEPLGIHPTLKKNGLELGRDKTENANVVKDSSCSMGVSVSRCLEGRRAVGAVTESQSNQSQVNQIGSQTIERPTWFI